MPPQLGKLFIVFGALVVVIGIVLLLADRIPFLGKLPGDISFKSGRTTVYIPLVTCLVISIILTVIFNLFGRGR
jgi:hypothetical protein